MFDFHIPTVSEDCFTS